MEGAAVSAAEVEAIASLPSREELYAHIAAAINGVAQGLATAINGVPVVWLRSPRPLPTRRKLRKRIPCSVKFAA